MSIQHRIKPCVFVMICAYILASCEQKHISHIPTTETKGVVAEKLRDIEEFDYKNHSYIMFIYGASYSDSQYHIVHNPDCKCQINQKRNITQ